MNEVISRRIIKLLLSKNMTQYKLALNSGLSHASITALIKSKHKGVNIITLYAICQGLGITIVDFFNDKTFLDDSIIW
jgi:transcriptional regulator with XRE-family HTH domain